MKVYKAINLYTLPMSDELKAFFQEMVSESDNHEEFLDIGVFSNHIDFLQCDTDEAKQKLIDEMQALERYCVKHRIVVLTLEYKFIGYEDMADNIEDREENPYIGAKVILKPEHFQLDSEDWEDFNMGIDEEDFYGECRIHSVGMDGGGEPENDYFHFIKTINGKEIIFPDAPINFYSIPTELSGH